jgi:hypothetical protein
VGFATATRSRRVSVTRRPKGSGFGDSSVASVGRALRRGEESEPCTWRGLRTEAGGWPWSCRDSLKQVARDPGLSAFCAGLSSGGGAGTENPC